MELISRALLFSVVVLAGVLLFTPYEAFLEGVIAVVIVAAAAVGFAMHPRREVFYVRTSVRLTAADRRQVIDKDLLAVRVEVARLWLLFAPTFLAVAFLVFFAAGGPTKFSFLNWIFTSRLTVVTIGGSHTVIPYVAQVAVSKLHWLTGAQMMDGFALAETTPGPLIIVVAFVGFLAGYNHFHG